MGISISGASEKKGELAKKMRPIFNPKTGGKKGWTGQKKGGIKDASILSVQKGKGHGVKIT